MIHLCRTLLWIFAEWTPLVNGDSTAAADLSRFVFISSDGAVATAVNWGSLPHGGSMNLTDPSAVSESNISPVASSAPSTSSAFAYTSICDPACAGISTVCHCGSGHSPRNWVASGTSRRCLHLLSDDTCIECWEWRILFDSC
ncbi:hypothetical protein NA56DRAFT_314081 [Hyaloscypha hepaticicola]|uniref:Secreted protein n=1 Tax=Hyaloscypha hepaticicola TaxID=2082293 RepID=A0A2J6PRE9_9HELO|nr:hypothetical protein NA56DRAFT_314081 [Hyaloscypha hepaticicola]